MCLYGMLLLCGLPEEGIRCTEAQVTGGFVLELGTKFRSPKE